MPLSPSSRLLIIYYNFPPVKVPGAVRIRNFYQACLPYFDKVLALTTSNRRFFLQDAGLETGCRNIHEVPAYDLRWLSLRKKGGNKPYVDINLKERPIIHLIRRMVDSFPLNVLIGDGGLVYILKGYRKGKALVEKEGVTHLFSTFRPYSDHIIAWLLKRRFPKLYWIADFRDLHVDPARKNVLWPAFQRWCNRQILHRADLVTTVSEGLKKQLQTVHPNIYVLRNGIPLSDRNIPEEVIYEKFTISYTGSLYPTYQSAQSMMKALKSLSLEGKIQTENFQLIYAGKDGAVWENWMKSYELSSFSQNLGLLTLEEAKKIQRKSHINLLLSWVLPDSGGILTCKLNEYISARRPILALIDGGKDLELEEILAVSDEYLIVENGQEKAVFQYIRQLIEKWNSGESFRIGLDSDRMQKLQWPEQIQDLLTQF